MHRGALADVVLWVLVRLQAHMFGGGTYSRVVACVEREEAGEKLELEAEARAAGGHSCVC